MNHHQCDIHMHPAAYVHGPVLITYLRDILAVGFWLGDLLSHPPTLLDSGLKGGLLQSHAKFVCVEVVLKRSPRDRGGLSEVPRLQDES